MTRRYPIPFALPPALLALLLAVPAMGGRDVDRTVPVGPAPEVEVESLSGTITVRAWDRPEVRVRGTLGDDVEELEIQADDDHVSIEVEIPDGRGRRLDVDAFLELFVPAAAAISVETVSANVEVEGVAGAVELESVSGSIEVSGRPEWVEAGTVSGSIRVVGVETPMEVESVSGSISIEGVARSVDASVVSGNLEVDASEIAEGDFESVSGSITFRGRLAAGAEVDFESHSGNVTLHLPADVSADFDIETFSGDVDNAFGPGAQRVSRYAPGRQLRFSTGGGSARVSVQTFSGNVRLRR